METMSGLDGLGWPNPEDEPKTPRRCQLTQQLEEVTKDRDLWQQEAKRWRDMYLEYDEMLEGQVNDAVDRLEKVWEGLDELKKKVEDEY